MVWRVIQSWAFLWSAAIVVLSWLALQTFPTASFWYKPYSIQVADIALGDPVVMMVNRGIKRPFLGEWTVTVRRFETQGPVVYCPPSTGSNDYEVDAALPDPLTLDWWTTGQCKIEDPGQYTITTTWTVKPRWLPNDRQTGPITSNVFTVYNVSSIQGHINRSYEFVNRTAP